MSYFSQTRQYNEKYEMEILGGEGGGVQGKVKLNKSSQSGWRGVSFYKSARVHNNMKGEDFIFYREVFTLG